MHKFIEEKDWEGTASALAGHANTWMRIKQIGEPSFVPNERLVRDYVAKGILSKPERKGKEALFSFEQLAQFLACRAMIEDGWPLSKISENFKVSSISDILKWVPGEGNDNDALSLIESFKNADYSEDIDNPPPIAMSMSTPSYGSDEKETQDFLRRSRENYESKADIKDVLRRLGSDFGNVIREDFTAYQLASWLVLLLDRDKAINITRAEAEDIGKGVTATLLNRGSLSKADRSSYTKQVRERSNLDDDIKIRKYELKRLQAEIQAQRSNLDDDIKKRKDEFKRLEAEIQAKMKRADQELELRQELIEQLEVKLNAYKEK